MSYPYQRNPYQQQNHYQVPQQQNPYQQPAPYYPPQQTPQTVVSKREANHTLHIILTFLTCGLWLPVWIIAAMKGRKTTTHYR